MVQLPRRPYMYCALQHFAMIAEIDEVVRHLTEVRKKQSKNDLTILPASSGGCT